MRTILNVIWLVLVAGPRSPPGRAAS